MFGFFSSIPTQLKRSGSWANTNLEERSKTLFSHLFFLLSSSLYRRSVSRRRTQKTPPPPPPPLSPLQTMWSTLSDKKGVSGAVVVAINRNKGSQSAFKWALENLLTKGQVVFLIHVSRGPPQGKNNQNLQRLKKTGPKTRSGGPTNQAQRPKNRSKRPQIRHKMP